MLKQNSLQDFLNKHSVKHTTSGESYVLECPRCLKQDKLWMYQSNGYFVCFYCREKEQFEGWPEVVLSEITGQSIQNVRIELYDNLSAATKEIPLKIRPYFDPDVIDDRQTIEFAKEFIDILDPLANDGLCYLESRGIPSSIALKYKLKYNPINKRIVFPVQESSRLFGWQARTIRPTEWVDMNGFTQRVPKVIGSKGTKLHKCLMFADNLIGSNHIVVCEGPIDAVKCDSVGGAVATMGKNVSDYQIDIIKKHPAKKVYLALDPDALSEIELVAKKLVSKELYLLVAPKPYKDLGEMTFKEVEELFHSAPKYTFSPLQIKMSFPF